MSVVVVQHVFAFFGNVWSCILTLVRSLLALFALRRRTSDPFSLPTANRTPNDALTRASSHLRPILLTPRSISLSRARTRSATSTILPAHSENPVTSASAPQRASPKLDPHDAELGLIIVTPSDFPGLPAASATSFREGTPDTSHTGSSYVPLTPPDRCYLAPLPPAIGSPYTEPWPTSGPLEHGKPRLPGSPLKVSTNTDAAFPEPKVAPIGSPPPGRWSPLQIWTSTPCKTDSPVLADPILASPFDPSPVLTTVSQALISRSQSSIQPYDDAANSSVSSVPSPLADDAHRQCQYQHYRTRALVPRFHQPDAYACMWRRHGARLPGKPDRTHAFARSQSHADVGAAAWYDADAYVLSPVTALSPPLSEDEDDMPLGRLKERLAHKGEGASVGLALSLSGGIGARVSPRTRRMSEGCLLAMSESTPTRVGVGARSGRQVLSVGLDSSGDGVRDWLDALSLWFNPEQKDAVPSVDVVAD
ncbi:hypothetical protein EV363DRAFT_1447854 [Boletus edulis]|nr:hypothetical protein EV363DRAFT_1447854 [Boletus edulis]